MVSTVNAGLSAVTGSSSADASQKVFGDNFDTFLKLLTTQLQNQDPLEPMENHEFTNQLVQFASVEQQIGANKNLEQLVAAGAANQNIGALSYLGKTVDVNADTVFFDGDNDTSFVYQADKNYTRASINIVNENGATVRVLEAPKEQGLHTVAWDGTDDNGNPLPSGYYALRVNGFDSQDVATPLSTIISGAVSAVGTENNETMLTVNGVPLPASAVIAVREPQAL